MPARGNQRFAGAGAPIRRIAVAGATLAAGPCNDDELRALGGKIDTEVARPLRGAESLTENVTFKTVDAFPKRGGGTHRQWAREVPQAAARVTHIKRIVAKC